MGHKLTCDCTAICRCAGGAAAKEDQRLLQLAGATERMSRGVRMQLTFAAYRAAGSAGAAVLVLRQPCLQVGGQLSVS